MEIGFTADNYRSLPVSLILRLFNWIGIGFSEVTTSIFSHPRRGLRSTRGMNLGLHLPNVGNCGFDISSEANREKVNSVLENLDKYRNMFNFQYAVFHPPEENPPRCSYDYYIHNLRQIKTPLLLENTRAYPLNHFLKFHDIVKKELGNSLAGVCLDIPHAYLAGEDWRAYYRRFKSEVKLIHLSNCDDELDRHLPFGMSGSLDLDEILGSLADFKFNGFLNFEIKPPSLSHLHLVFYSFLRAKDYFQPDGIGRIRRRMRLVGFLGRVLGLILHPRLSFRVPSFQGARNLRKRRF